MNVRQVVRALVTPVTMLALLAVVGYGAWWGYKQVTVDTTRPAATCVPTDVGGTLTPEHVTVRVLNGGETGGHAKTTRGFLIAYGFKVVYFNNSDRPVTVTTIVGNAADDPEVLLVQKMFDGAVTEGDGRADHVVDVIVGTKYQELNNPEKPTLPVEGPLCLPAITRPSGLASPSATPGSSASATPTPAKSSSKKK